MSCGRQNFRSAGNNFGSGSRMTGCASNCVAPAGVVSGCATNCAVPAGGIVTGRPASEGCGAPCAANLLEEMPLGMAYVPWQTFGTMYPMQQGFRRGTMFPCLDFDFMGRRCN